MSNPSYNKAYFVECADGPDVPPGGKRLRYIILKLNISRIHIGMIALPTEELKSGNSPQRRYIEWGNI